MCAFLFKLGCIKNFTEFGRWAPGCVNPAGKAGRSGRKEQEQNSPNLGPAFQPSPVLIVWDKIAFHTHDMNHNDIDI